MAGTARRRINGSSGDWVIWTYLASALAWVSDDTAAVPCPRFTPAFYHRISRTTRNRPPPHSGRRPAPSSFRSIRRGRRAWMAPTANPRQVKASAYINTRPVDDTHAPTSGPDAAYSPNPNAASNASPYHHPGSRWPSTSMASGIIDAGNQAPPVNADHQGEHIRESVRRLLGHAALPERESQRHGHQRVRQHRHRAQREGLRRD